MPKKLTKMLNLDFQERSSKNRMAILGVINLQGGDEFAYCKERHKAVRGLVSEIYPSPRGTAAADVLPQVGYTSGCVFDLITKNDIDRASIFVDLGQRKSLRARVEPERPTLLVGSPHVRVLVRVAAHSSL